MQRKTPWPQFLSAFGLLAVLTACSGMGGPGGGASSAGGGPGGLQSLDGGGNSLGGGGDLAGGGGAVPSTQQSDPGIGGPCGMGIPVRARVIENGFVRNCDGSLGPRAEFADVVSGGGDGMMTKTLGRAETFDPGDAEMYDEPLDYNPKVKVDFVPEGGGYFERHMTLDASCRPDGLWETWVTLRWGHAADGRLCADYRLSLSAFLRSAGTYYYSSAFQTSSVPREARGDIAPVLLAIDRGRTAP